MDDYIKNGCKKNETYSRLDCYHNRPYGSEAGGDPVGVVLRICRNSLEKYFTGSKFTDNSLILMRSQIFVVVLILNIF